jgi:hypothetical protein
MQGGANAILVSSKSTPDNEGSFGGGVAFSTTENVEEKIWSTPFIWPIY